MLTPHPPFARILDPQIYDYEAPFGTKFGLTKAERLQTRRSTPTHAMVITGVHLDDKGCPVRYRVENSWGDTIGNKGFLVMTARCFEEYVFEDIVPKAHMPARLWKIYTDGPQKTSCYVMPWDPLATPLTSEARIGSAKPPASNAAASTAEEKAEAVEEEDEEEEEYKSRQSLLTRLAYSRRANWLISSLGTTTAKKHDSCVRKEDAVNCKEMLAEYWDKQDNWKPKAGGR